MNTKFIIGDEVLCMDASGSGGALTQGQIYTVSKVNTSHDTLSLEGLPDESWLMARFSPTIELPVPKNIAAIRKGQPVATGVLAYFGKALKHVAEVSLAGGQQHAPGQPLHWDRSKSKDQLDALSRHLIDHFENPFDTDGKRHLAKVAWRALAQLQLDLEAEEATNEKL